MSYAEHSYALGFDADFGDFTNFEETFTLPYLMAELRIPRGSVTEKALSGRQRTDGIREVVMQQLGDPYGTTLFADLDAYVTEVWGGWNGSENTDMTLHTEEINGVYVYLNVIAYLPILGVDFEFNPLDNAYIMDLKLRHTIIGEAATEEP